MTTTPLLGIGLMATSTAQKEVVFNEALVTLDVLVGRVVIDKDLTSPPGSPSDGDAYIINTGSPTGLWAGHAKEIAFWFNGWRFIDPPNKVKMFVSDESKFYTYTAGSTTWSEDAAGTPATLDDLTDVAASTPADGEFLVFDDGASAWVPLTAYPAPDGGLTGQILRKVSDDDGDFDWTDETAGTGVSEFADLDDVNMGAVADGFIPVWDATPGELVFVDPATLVTVPNLADIGDVSSVTPATNDVLAWSGAAWGPSSVSIQFLFENMIDGPGTMVGAAGQILVVNALETELEYLDPASVLTAGVDLADLADVNVAGPSNGDVLTWDTTPGEWVALAPSTPALEDLTDVDLSTPPSDGEALVWDSGSSTWVPAAVSSALSVLSDVNLTSPANGAVLTYDSGSSKWIDGAAPAGTFASLTDGPGSLGGEEYKAVSVNSFGLDLEYTSRHSFGTTVGKSALHTLALTDAGKIIRCSSGPWTLTIPSSGAVAFDTGTEIMVVNSGAGLITLDGSAATTFYNLTGRTTIRQNEVVILTKTGSNDWAVRGFERLTILGFTDFPSSFSASAYKTLRVNSSNNAVEFVETPYDVATAIAGAPDNAEVIGPLYIGRACNLPSSATGSIAKSLVAATAGATFTLKKNGSSIGTIVWSASGTTGAFTGISSTNFAAGDYLTIECPGTADATLADIGFTLLMTRNS